MFVECIPSGTRRTSSLSSAALKTLGKKKAKEGVCRVSKEKHSAKSGFAECQKKNTPQTNKNLFSGKKEEEKK